MAFDTSGPQMGVIVSDLCVTGPKRGTYKVYIPKLNGNITDKTDYAGFGVNLGGLNAAELTKAQAVAIDCYPAFPLESGGAMPMNPETCVSSSDENTTDISATNSARVQGGKVVKGASEYLEGNYANTTFSQSYGAESLTQIYMLDTASGFTSNLHEGMPGGSIGKLSINTKVIVQNNFIIGMLPETQNDWINQFPPLNQGL